PETRTSASRDRCCRRHLHSRRAECPARAPPPSASRGPGRPYPRARSSANRRCYLCPRARSSDSGHQVFLRSSALPSFLSPAERVRITAGARRATAAQIELGGTYLPVRAATSPAWVTALPVPPSE